MNPVMVLVGMLVGMALIATGILVALILQMQKQVSCHEKRITDLENKLPKFQTHRNAMTRENLVALADKLVREQVEATMVGRTLIAILQNMHDPNYDPELPINMQRKG